MRWAVSVCISRLSVLSTVSICLSVSQRHPTLMSYYSAEIEREWNYAKMFYRHTNLEKTFLLTVSSTFVRSVSRSGREKMWNLKLVLLCYLTHSSKLTMDDSTLMNSFSIVLILGRCEHDDLRRKKSRWPTRETNFKIIRCTNPRKSKLLFWN